MLTFFLCNFFFKKSSKHTNNAQDSAYNAVRNVFGDSVKILMCWFHLMKNVREHLKQVPEKEKEKIMGEITGLHHSMNEAEFASKWNAFKLKWTK